MGNHSVKTAAPAAELAVEAAAPSSSGKGTEQTSAMLGSMAPNMAIVMLGQSTGGRVLSFLDLHSVLQLGASCHLCESLFICSSDIECLLELPILQKNRNLFDIEFAEESNLQVVRKAAHRIASACGPPRGLPAALLESNITTLASDFAFSGAGSRGSDKVACAKKNSKSTHPKVQSLDLSLNLEGIQSSTCSGSLSPMSSPTMTPRAKRTSWTDKDLQDTMLEADHRVHLQLGTCELIDDTLLNDDALCSIDEDFSRLSEDEYDDFQPQHPQLRSSGGAGMGHRRNFSFFSYSDLEEKTRQVLISHGSLSDLEVWSLDHNHARQSSDSSPGQLNSRSGSPVRPYSSRRTPRVGDGAMNDAALELEEDDGSASDGEGENNGRDVVSLTFEEVMKSGGKLIPR